MRLLNSKTSASQHSASPAVNSLAPSRSSASPARQSASMLSFLRKGKKNHQHIHADALPATAAAVQDVEASSVSRRFTQSALGLPSLPPGQTLALRCAVCYLPHPDKVYYGGEDAYFVSDVGGGAMGVADGVGGWQESGVNPADYSRLFMKISCNYLEGKDAFANDGLQRPFIDPRGVLSVAHDNTKVPGSATACVMQLDAANKSLEAANLGDSGFVVLRKGQVVARSKALQHYFDCPLQFGAFPEFVEATDTADMADTYSIPLAPGDVVIAGTDGLWDNVFDTEIISLLPRASSEVQRSADRIAATARMHAGDADFQSPYVREALSQGLDLPWWEKIVGASFKNGKFALKQLAGGKMDDITVMVALVEAVDVPPPPAEAPATDDKAAAAGTTAEPAQPQQPAATADKAAAPPAPPAAPAAPPAAPPAAAAAAAEPAASKEAPQPALAPAGQAPAAAESNGVQQS